MGNVIPTEILVKFVRFMRYTDIVGLIIRYDKPFRFCESYYWLEILNEKFPNVVDLSVLCNEGNLMLISAALKYKKTIHISQASIEACKSGYSSMLKLFLSKTRKRNKYVLNCKTTNTLIMEILQNPLEFPSNDVSNQQKLKNRLECIQLMLQRL